MVGFTTQNPEALEEHLTFKQLLFQSCYDFVTPIHHFVASVLTCFGLNDAIVVHLHDGCGLLMSHSHAFLSLSFFYDVFFPMVRIWVYFSSCFFLRFCHASFMYALCLVILHFLPSLSFFYAIFPLIHNFAILFAPFFLWITVHTFPYISLPLACIILLFQIFLDASFSVFLLPKY